MKFSNEALLYKKVNDTINDLLSMLQKIKDHIELEYHYENGGTSEDANEIYDKVCDKIGLYENNLEIYNILYHDKLQEEWSNFLFKKLNDFEKGKYDLSETSSIKILEKPMFLQATDNEKYIDLFKFDSWEDVVKFVNSYGDQI